MVVLGWWLVSMILDLIFPNLNDSLISWYQNDQQLNQTQEKNQGDKMP